MENLKLLKLPVSENRIQNVIDRFHHDLTQDDDSLMHTQNMLAVIHDYLISAYDTDDCHEMAQVVVNLQASILWLDYCDIDSEY